jgi:hypothetical protein
MKLRYCVLLLTILVFGLVVAQPISQPPIKTDQIKFTSQPPSTGQVGVAYTYKAKAVSSDSTAKIYYSPYQLIMAYVIPYNKFTVDSATGLLTFTPQVKGWYMLGVTAHSTKGGVATQIFYITVTGGNGIVQGTVTDTSLQKIGIKGVIIELYKTDTSASPQIGNNIIGNPLIFQSDGSFSFCAVTDASGNYRITGIDPGKYKIHATSPSRLYDSQWYDGKTNSTDATPVTVDNNLVSLVNIVLKSGVAAQPKVSISGSVKDTLKVPIKKAEVIFVNSNFALNANDSVDDFREYFDINAGKIDCKLDGGSQQVIHIFDSTNGAFNANIPPGSYIAFAKADGYVNEFYQEQSSLLLATTIVVKQNTPVTNINFTLAPVPPVVLGSISGSVIDSSKGVGVPSRIIVSNASKPSRAYTVDTDSLGVYSVTKLPPGNYFVLALPLGKYPPSYYTNDTASIRWKKASTLTVSGNSISGINIYVHQFAVSASGYTGVRGTVRSLGAPSTAIPGAFVYAIKNNQVAGYSITNNTGAFSIDELAPGSYSVTVDNLGSTEPSSLTASVSYTSTGSPVDATINFSLSSTTSVETSSSVQPEGFTLSQNYPNPFNPSTTINYTIQQPGMVILKVYNIVGQEIRTLVSNYQAAGNYQATLNAQNLSSGVYFYRLQSNNNTLMRKMILLR